MGTTTSQFQSNLIFYQFVTDKVFEVLIKHHFYVKLSHKDEISTLANALRYIADYVFQAIKYKICTSPERLNNFVSG